MDNVVDLAEARAAKAGIITPRRAIAEVEAYADEIVALAVVGIMRNGAVATSFSTAPNVTLLGMLEVAKDDVLYAEGSE